VKGDPVWVEAKERQYGALHFVRRARANLARQSISDRSDALLEATEVALPRAIPFAWASEATTAVTLAAKTIPDSAALTLAMLPEGVPFQFWYFAEPVRLPLSPYERQKFTVGQGVDYEHLSAVLVARGQAPTKTPGVDYIMLVGFRLSWHDNSPVKLLAPSEPLVIADSQTIASWRVAAASHTPEVPDDYGNRLAMVRLVYAASIWLKERLVVASACHIERHRRKQLARDYPTLTLTPDVHLIALRRYASETHPRAEGGGAAVDWHYRWVVSGHWRELPQPRKKDGLTTTWVMPHVKGPADKPIKTGSTVYVVKR
jgi:hypothetical protein